MHLFRILYRSTVVRTGWKYRRGEREGGDGFETIRSTRPLRPSLGIDATRITPLHTYKCTRTHTHARVRTRESERLASIPPFSGLSRTSCETTSTSTSVSRDVSMRARYTTTYMYTRGVLEILYLLENLHFQLFWNLAKLEKSVYFSSFNFFTNVAFCIIWYIFLYIFQFSVEVRIAIKYSWR